MIAQSSAQPVLRVRDVSKFYSSGASVVPALIRINLEFFAGEFVVLLGASGSGKSSLLHLLGGLDVASLGSVWFQDLDLTSADEASRTRYRREHVGFVFQFYNLIPSLTALENVALVAELGDTALDPMEVLSWVGMATRAGHFPSQLSGGEQQRVAIARAVVKRPEILLCDEPTGALDYVSGKCVLEVLDRLNRSLGSLVVVITHNAAIAKMADRVIHLSSGEVVSCDVNPTRASLDSLSW